MPNTFFDNNKVKRWFNDNVKVKKAFFDNALVFQDEYVLNITASNHNCPKDYVWSLLPADIQATSGTIRIVIAGGVQLVGATTQIPVLDFYGGWGGKTVIVENWGTILGRGGNGGNEAQSGGAGARLVHVGGARCSVTARRRASLSSAPDSAVAVDQLARVAGGAPCGVRVILAFARVKDGA